MTLSFQTKWPSRMGELAGQPNYFVERIWRSLKSEELVSYSKYWIYQDDHLSKLGYFWDDGLFLKPKHHTIRYDPHNRWKPGMKIHPVINNRTKNRFQFAPVLECVSVQEIEIINLSSSKKIINIENEKDNPFFSDGDREDLELINLVHNDGFPSVKAFFQYFNEDFKGKIIHWTDLKY